VNAQRLLRSQRLWVLLALLALFIPVSLRRYIDGDEGYLLYAARLITAGKSLYSDFFCPQAPLVPTVFSLLYKVTGPGWYSARVLAAIFAAISGLLVFQLGRRHGGSGLTGMLAVFFYAGCGYTLGWIPIAKTYGLAVVCLLAGTEALERGGKYAALLGGLFITLALEARLYVGVIGLNALVYILRRPLTLRDRLRDVGMLATGAALGLSFLIPPFVRSFETAFFGVFKFATIRFPEQTTLFGPISQKIDVLLAELSIVGQDGAGSAQLLGLVVLGTTAWFVRDLGPNRLSATIWPTLLLVNLLPYNTFTQYVCIVVPFVAVEAALLVGRVFQSGLPRPALATGLVLYGALGYLDMQRFVSTGASVIGVWDNPHAWRISHVLEVARQVDSFRAPQAVSWWPGYFVTTQTTVIPELANHFGFHVTERLSAEQRRKLVLISEGELQDAIGKKQYPLVVLGNWAGAHWAERLTQTYKVERTIGYVTLWRAQ
jgi:hypothetical protein